MKREGVSKIATPMQYQNKGDNKRINIKKDVIKMTAPKLRPKETRPKITCRETSYKASKRLSNRLCGIALILLGIVSAVASNDATAAVMLVVMGLTAVFTKD